MATPGNLSAAELKLYESSLKSLAKLTNQIIDLNASNEDILDDVVDAAAELNDEAKLYLAQLKQTDNVDKQLLDKAKEKIDLIKKQVKAGQALEKQRDIEQKALDEINAKWDDMETKFRGFMAKGKAFFSSWKGFAVGIGLVAAALFVVYKDLVSAQTDARQELGVTGESFEKLRDVSTELNVEWAKLGVGIKKSYEITQAIAMEFGSFDYLTNESANNVAAMTVALGMIADDAAKTLSSFMDITAGSQESANNMLKMAAATADANGVPMGKTIRDITDNAEGLARYMKGTGQNIVDATVAANKLGFSVSTIVDIADSLLSFESSIENEMNAMVLTGKQLNLGRARQLAIEGDLAGLQREITDNLISEYEWGELNTLQKKSMADALGIGVNEMGKMISRERILNGLVKGTLTPMKAMAEGATLSEVLNAEGIIDPLKKLMNSLIRITSILVKILNPAFEALSGLISILTFDFDNIEWVPFLKCLGLTAAGLLLIWGIGRLIKSLDFGSIFNFGGSKAGAAGKKGIFGRIFGSMSWGDVAKGLVIMAGLAATLWILGAAMKQFADVEWEDLAMAGVAMGGLLVAATLLGVLMASPLGVALLTGMLVLVGMAASLWILGQALQAVKVGMDGLAPSLIGIAGVAGDLVIAAGAIYMLGGALAFLAASLAAGSILDFFGLGGGGGMIDKLLELANNSDKLAVVAAAVQTIATGGAGGGVAVNARALTTAGTVMGDTNVNVSLDDVVNKLDEIESMFKNGVELKMNGAKVGEWLAKEARKT